MESSRMVTKRNCLGAAVAALVLALGASSLVGCQEAAEPAPESVIDSLQPKVVRLDDGTLVQRTPNEDISPTMEADGAYHHPSPAVPQNTYYLNADERGCNACHEDLVDATTTAAYNHPNLTNAKAMGTELTVSQCIDCHTHGIMTVPDSFGATIHGIHSKVEGANCESCHYMSGGSVGVQLWDNVKHDVLHGIKAVENVSGEFTFTQDTKMTQDQLVNINWQFFEDDYQRNDNQKENVPLDEELFENWTISLSGLVDNPTTYKLGELTEDSSLIKTMTLAYPCVEYTYDGNMLGQAEATGISLKALLERAGVQEGAGSIIATSTGGYEAGFDIARLEDRDALLVFEIDGERLQWGHGYPVQLWVQGAALPFFVKNLCDIVVDTYENMGHYEGARAIPAIGFTNFHEGTVVKTGEPVTFTGYAFGYDRPVTAVEFSMDGGNTWTSYPIENMDGDRIVSWSFTTTPERDGAYVLRARTVIADHSFADDLPSHAASQDGSHASEETLVTETPVSRLFNAKSE